jgi:membrane protease YdiL (CAAX protease family)
MTTAAAQPSALGLSLPAPAHVSPRAVILVLLMSLGLFAVNSAAWLFQAGGRLSGFQIRVDSGGVVFVLVYEVVVGLILILFLKRRGWRLEQVTLPFAPRDVVRGLGLWLLAMLSAWTVMASLTALSPTYAAEVMGTRIVGDPTSMPLIAAVVLINPLYEELVYLGFVPAAFPRSAAWQILLLSTALRVLVHTYQGILSLLFILPWGVVFAVYYMRTRKLWPVVLAHALQDAIGFAVISNPGG